MSAGRLYRIALLMTVIGLFTTVGAAHEIYVLPADSINQTMMADSPNPLTAAQDYQLLFAVFVLGLLATIAAAVYLPFTDRFNDRYAEVLDELTAYAPYMGQATLGVGLIVFATHEYLFGPEIPLQTISTNVQTLSLLLYLTGLLLVFNIETRISGLFALLTYIVVFLHSGGYAIHYAAYLGLALYVVLRNEQPAADSFLAALLPTSVLPTHLTKNPGIPHLLLRLFYGTAIIYAAVYAKYVNSNIALTTIEHLALEQYLPVAPLFLVLCLLVLEVVIGAAFILGIEVRLAAVLLLLVNAGTLVAFGESLWPHVWMIGGALTIFFHGYDPYTAENVLMQKLQPVLETWR